MPSHELAPLVRAFITEHLRTVEDLQLLMLLVHDRDRWWDTAAVAAELGISADLAGHALDHLASRNLLDIRVTGDIRYQFSPGTDQLREAAFATTDAYFRSPVQVLHLVGGSTRRSIRDFADAFRIRRHDDR